MLTTKTTARVQRDAHKERNLGFILSVKVEVERKKYIVKISVPGSRKKLTNTLWELPFFYHEHNRDFRAMVIATENLPLHLLTSKSFYFAFKNPKQANHQIQGLNRSSNLRL